MQPVRRDGRCSLLSPQRSGTQRSGETVFGSAMADDLVASVQGAAHPGRVSHLRIPMGFSRFRMQGTRSEGIS